MKLIALNVWGGRKEGLLADFFAQYKDEVDIFCLQEVIHDAAGKIANFPENNENFFADTSEILVNFQGYFRPAVKSHYGLATFVHEDLNVSEEDDIFVVGAHGDSYDFETDEDHPRNVQHLTLKKGGEKFVVHNFHGLWTSKGKIDTLERITQSENVAEHLKEQTLPQIIAGDFNMRPELQSLEIIENVGVRNLVKEFDIKDTRTSFYPKEERFADYILVSDKITVKDFRVLPEEVSDHAPLYLDFEIAK